MVEKIEAGKRYRVDLNQVQDYSALIEDLKEYSNNGIILISNLLDNGVGVWEFKKDGFLWNNWMFTKENLIPLREEAFLEIFKEELKEK